LELVLVAVAFVVVVIAIVVAGAFDLLAEVESIGATPDDDPAPAPTTPSPELPCNGGYINSPFIFTPLPPPHHDHPLSRECDPS
jgi:hypothetical protein